MVPNTVHGGKAAMHTYQTNQYEGMIAETVTMRGHNGDIINAYVARPAGVPGRLQAGGPRRGHRVLGRSRGHGEGRADAEPAGGAHRLHQGPLVSDPRALRQR